MQELKTACGYLMPPQQHLCNGLARPADYSIFARNGLARTDTCWPTVIVAEQLLLTYTAIARLALQASRRWHGQPSGQTRCKHNAPTAGYAARSLRAQKAYQKNDAHGEYFSLIIIIITRGQSNLTKSASWGAHSPIRGHPRGSKVVPLNSWGRVSY